MSKNVRALTLRELTELVAAVAEQPLTDRQVRYLLLTGRLGADTEPRAHGKTRLYGPLDVALVRLAVELRAQGLSPQVARAALTYLRDDLVRAWRTAAPLALAVRGARASLEPALKGRPPKTIAWIRLRGIWHGLEAKMQEVADGRDHVWMYKPIRASAIPRNPF